MDYVRRDQEEHPYAIGLKSGIEAKYSECCVKRALCEWRVLWVCQRPCGDKAIDIFKGLVVDFSFHLINTKVFPFPIYDLCEYQSFIIRFLDHEYGLLIYLVTLILFLFLMLLFRYYRFHEEQWNKVKTFGYEVKELFHSSRLII